MKKLLKKTEHVYRLQREAEEEAERQRQEEERQRREEEEARELAQLQRKMEEEKLRKAIEVFIELIVSTHVAIINRIDLGYFVRRTRCRIHS